MKLSNSIVIEKAKNLGFDLIGFSNAEKLDTEIEYLNKWIDKGFHSKMAYMERNIEKRENVKEILENAESVISLGMNYYRNKNFSNDINKGKVSRYAWGKDYHLIIWEKLDRLIDELVSVDENFIAKSYVDTGPVMDKAWAVRSGLGWMGKHTNVINQQSGSWFFIATIITNHKFVYNEPVTDHCGTCTLCIDACPTDAIVSNYEIDSNKCISYLTIENRGEIPNEFKDKFNGWLFGCDICQDVCPWNLKFSVETIVGEFKSTENIEIELKEISDMTNKSFKEKFNSSPISRARLKGLKRNAKFLEN